MRSADERFFFASAGYQADSPAGESPAASTLVPEPEFERTPGRFIAAFALAVLGGAFGILGALFQELRAGISPLIAIVGAPIIEEFLKPSGIYVVVGRWPRLFERQLYIALLASISGLVFGLIESVVYASLYVDDPSSAYLLFRFTVPVALHMTASFIAGWGVSAVLLRWASSGGRFPRASRNAFAAAIALHAIYNTTAIALSIAGVLDFD